MAINAVTTSLMVKVESMEEHKIFEVTPDGQEIYVPTLSMSDDLTKNAQKIDFSKTEDDNDESKLTEPESDEITTDKSLVTFQQPKWPWETVHAKLRNALTEVFVLLDVLNVAKEKKYMVLDAVQQPETQPFPLAQLLAKKKALSHASQLLTQGAEKLRKYQEQSNRESTMSAFDSELYQLRKNWRVKKVGNNILGDLSYKSAGSRYWQSGAFEVTKCSEEASLSSSDSILEVTIPSELEGSAYILVAIQKDEDIIASTRMTAPGHRPPTDTNWQRKLETAQTVLYCKELFSQLAREAVQLKADIPHMVVGNQITCSIFPGIQLVIGLCHSTGHEKKGTRIAPKPGQSHNHILEHSLHQLLRELHKQTSDLPLPHPATALLGPRKRRRLAGPSAASRVELLEMSETKSLLEEIIDQARHTVLRIRTTHVLDSVANHKDPQLVIHWNTLSDSTHCSIKINITSCGYETTSRTSLALHVGTTSIRLICRDGRTMNLCGEVQELMDMLLQQITQHQVNGVLALSKQMGWNILSSCSHLGVGEVEPIGNASSVLITSPDGDTTLAVRLGAVTGLKLYLQKVDTETTKSNYILQQYTGQYNMNNTI